MLDGRSWRSKDNFYDAFFQAVRAPEWHGRNLDALWDSITGRDLNDCDLPYRIVISGHSVMSREAAEIVARFQELVEEAKRQGHPISLSSHCRAIVLGHKGGPCDPTQKSDAGRAPAP